MPPPSCSAERDRRAATPCRTATAARRKDPSPVRRPRNARVGGQPRLDVPAAAVSTVTICVVPRYSAPKTSPRNGARDRRSALLGAHPEHQLGPAAVLAQPRHRRCDAHRARPAAPRGEPRNGRKFIGGEPMKSATNRAGRPVVDLLRRAELLDHAVVHHGDRVGHRHRLELVMGDIDRGRAEAVVQRREARRTSASRNSASSAPSGSSIRKPFGWRTMARPSATRCRSPPARPRHRAVEQMIDPQDARRLLDPPVGSRRGMPWQRSGKPIFLRTFMCG